MFLDYVDAAAAAAAAAAVVVAASLPVEWLVNIFLIDFWIDLRLLNMDSQFVN